MSWGCKPENHPNGCGWAARLTYPRMGFEEWWCDACERAGETLTTPVEQGDSRSDARYDRGTNKDGPGTALTVLSGASPTVKESTGA